MKRLSLLSAAAALAIVPSLAFGQAAPTATRLADLQVGAGFTYANTDYVPNNVPGYMFYADYDVLGHYGLEVNFHHVTNSDPDPIVPSNHFSMHTYEAGGRYLLHYRRETLAPYAKLLYGRGVVNFPAHQVYVPTGLETYIDNIAYNLVSFGAGVDYRLTRRVNLRADFEYQHWFAHDAELPKGLAPWFFSVGGAYHFPSRGPNR